MEIIKAKDENGENEKDLVLCEDPLILTAYMKTHIGIIVAVKYDKDLGMAMYHTNNYTTDNLGYQVSTPNGYERAYNLVQNGCNYSWGVIDSMPKQ